MSVTLITPRYAHRRLSQDERFDRKIANPLDPGDTLPQVCGDCGCSGSIRNPLMMRPVFKMDDGRPKGELYQCRCSDCQVKRVRRR